MPGAIRTSADLPVGIRDTQGPGHYRLEHTGGDRLFDWAVGPGSWKAEFFPPSHELWRSTSTGEITRPRPDAECTTRRHHRGPTLRTGGSGRTGPGAADGAVTDPATRPDGPAPSWWWPSAAPCRNLLLPVDGHGAGGDESGFDLALTELDNGDGRAMSSVSGATGVLHPRRDPACRAVSPSDLAAQRPDTGVGGGGHRAPPRHRRAWPGCWPATSSIPAGTRWPSAAWPAGTARWSAPPASAATCPTPPTCPATCDASAPGPPASISTTPICTADRCGPRPRSRYRQWLTHKLSTWWDQFDTSGCVGCGRCIAWCPVGIDLTEEAAAIRCQRRGASGPSLPSTDAGPGPGGAVTADDRGAVPPIRSSPGCPRTPCPRSPAVLATWPSHPDDLLLAEGEPGRHPLPRPAGPGGDRGPRPGPRAARDRDGRAGAARWGGAGCSRPTGGSSTPAPSSRWAPSPSTPPACGPRSTPTRARATQLVHPGRRRPARTAAGDPAPAARSVRDRRWPLS